jgi:hypothetical protein
LPDPPLMGQSLQNMDCMQKKKVMKMVKSERNMLNQYVIWAYTLQATFIWRGNMGIYTRPVHVYTSTFYV